MLGCERCETVFADEDAKAHLNAQCVKSLMVQRADYAFTSGIRRLPVLNDTVPDDELILSHSSKGEESKSDELWTQTPPFVI